MEFFIMNLIAHDPKDCSTSYPSPWLPIGLIRGIIFGGSIIIQDSNGASDVLEEGGFGHFLGERQGRVNRGVFRDQYEQVKDKTGNVTVVEIENEKGIQWSAKSPTSERLRLSAEESAFLAIDEGVLEVSEYGNILPSRTLWSRLMELGGPNFVKRYALFRTLRGYGWCVRSGLSYGCEYLIYRDGPQFFHAAAGVRIEDELDPRQYIAINRALTNMKKAILIATIIIPTDLKIDKPECIHKIQVSINTSTTMFIDRKMKEEIEKSETIRRKRSYFDEFKWRVFIAHSPWTICKNSIGVIAVEHLIESLYSSKGKAADFDNSLKNYVDVL